MPGECQVLCSPVSAWFIYMHAFVMSCHLWSCFMLLLSLSLYLLGLHVMLMKKSVILLFCESCGLGKYKIWCMEVICTQPALHWNFYRTTASWNPDAIHIWWDITCTFHECMVLYWSAIRTLTHPPGRFRLCICIRILSLLQISCTYPLINTW